MKRSATFAAAASAVALFAQAGLAQSRILQFDVNNLSYQALNAAGAPSAFGGTTHTGSLVLTDLLPNTELVAIAISTGGGAFTTQPGAPWNLTDASLVINLNNGAVTGGSFLLDINGGPAGGGDRYTANVGSAGAVGTYVGGGFTVEGLTLAGNFSDASFGPVNVADFFAAQGGNLLQGSFLAFKITPDAGGGGYADVDAFVSNVPAPGTLACFAGAGLLVARRRRR